MRIGTWNLNADESGRSDAFLASLDGDVLLLTEPPRGLTLPGYQLRFSEGTMARGQAFAAVATRTEPQSSVQPHPASIGSQVGGTTFLASVLPWRSAKDADGFPGTSQGERTREAVETLADDWPPGRVVWGGDLNHELTGRIGAGSKTGRDAILRLMRDRDLQVPTSVLGAATGYGSVNHIALPSDWTIMGVARHVAEVDGQRLSDHDAYVVEVNLPGDPTVSGAFRVTG